MFGQGFADPDGTSGGGEGLLPPPQGRDDLDDPEFRDTYTDAPAQIIEAKREDRPLPKTPEPEATGGKVLDLMTARNESVAKANAARGAGADDVHEILKKKTAANKTTAEKTTAKKPSTRRPRAAPKGVAAWTSS
ncbi:hypothetical protein [Streptomyces chartreusis]|uniref:hypothetical protein n=1 Tax=Streptomyces chartreusis TaxID=1969 RepID=UPI00123D271A|nr:hypothetical protein [Streptomyces chartreusis]GGX50470.1 hypothetical protein GCM10010321_79550 [Streptomyces chartreusis]